MSTFPTCGIWKNYIKTKSQSLCYNFHAKCCPLKFQFISWDKLHLFAMFDQGCLTRLSQACSQCGATYLCLPPPKKKRSAKRSTFCRKMGQNRLGPKGPCNCLVQNGHLLGVLHPPEKNSGFRPLLSLLFLRVLITFLRQDFCRGPSCFNNNRDFNIYRI